MVAYNFASLSSTISPIQFGCFLYSIDVDPLSYKILLSTLKVAFSRK